MRAWVSKNLLLLVLSQALSMAGVSGVVLIGGIIGAELSPLPVLSTLPASLMIVGTAISVIPAALLMRQVGRRFGFMLGAFISGAGMLLAMLAVILGNFWLLCFATFLVGVNSAFVQQYRFAAIESVAPRFTSRAVSVVLVGGAVAGFLGPEVVRFMRNSLPMSEFSGSFLGLLVLSGLSFGLLFLLKDSKIEEGVQVLGERPLSAIVSQPMYLTAVMCSALSFGVMTFIMTATPVYMHHIHGFSVDQTAWVLQSHIIAMFLPSLFSGWIVEKLGLERVIYLGLGFFLACVVIGIFGQELLEFWGALVLLGLGWNFLYVSGTVLLARTYRESERFKSQATSDFIALGIQAFTALSAGSVLFATNWSVLNLINLPFLVMAAAVIFFQRQRVTAVAPGL